MATIIGLAGFAEVLIIWEIRAFLCLLAISMIGGAFAFAVPKRELYWTSLMMFSGIEVFFRPWSYTYDFWILYFDPKRSTWGAEMEYYGVKLFEAGLVHLIYLPIFITLCILTHKKLNRLNAPAFLDSPIPAASEDI